MIGSGILVDALEAIADTDRWRSLSHTYRPPSAAMGDDYLIVPLNGCVGSDGWTAFFDWYPLEGWANFIFSNNPLSGTNVPIATFTTNRAGYFDLLYDFPNQRFKITDGINSASFDPITPWQHYDRIRFVVTSDGTDTVIYSHDPINGTQSAVLSGIAACPVLMRLGVFHDLSNVGCGRYADIGFDRTFMDVFQVEDLLTQVEPAPVTCPLDGDPDSDSDGFTDHCDNCPNAANPDQADSDHDGTGDACDGCPNEPSKAAPGICGCDVPDVDTDNDGIMDCVDNCLNNPNHDQADADYDGVGDACDQCPDTPLGTRVGADGCPISAPGDFDRDGDVDQADFGHLQACLSGADVPQNDPACQNAKLDPDNDVDVHDLDIFLGCMSGSRILADPNCAN